MNLCDFCSSPAPAWIYPCKSFKDMTGGISMGEWLACDHCHSLIERGAFAALAYHAATSLDHVKNWDVSFGFCQDLFARFREHRTGPAQRLK